MDEDKKIDDKKLNEIIKTTINMINIIMDESIHEFQLFSNKNSSKPHSIAGEIVRFNTYRISCDIIIERLINNDKQLIDFDNVIKSILRDKIDGLLYIKEVGNDKSKDKN